MELFKELEHEIQNNEDMDGTVISYFSDKNTKWGRKYRSMVFKKVLGVDNFEAVTPEGLRAFILNIKNSDFDTFKKMNSCIDELLILIKKEKENSV
jgi:hypothetical protein